LRLDHNLKVGPGYPENDLDLSERANGHERLGLSVNPALRPEIAFNGSGGFRKFDRIAWSSHAQINMLPG
jgi:hypothetical protein